MLNEYIINQLRAGEEALPIFKKIGIENPELLSQSLCGISSLGSCINELYQKIIISARQTENTVSVGQIYQTLIKFHGKTNLTSLYGNFSNPNPWSVFADKYYVFHHTLSTVAAAFGLNSRNFIGLTKPSDLGVHINNSTKSVLSFSSQYSIENAGTNGTHLIGVVNYSYQDDTFDLADPYNPNGTSGFSRERQPSTVINTFQKGNGILISKQPLPENPVGFSYTPIMDKITQPGTKPWPVFIPKEVVEEIRKLII